MGKIADLIQDVMRSERSKGREADKGFEEFSNDASSAPSLQVSMMINMVTGSIAAESLGVYLRRQENNEKGPDVDKVVKDNLRCFSPQLQILFIGFLAGKKFAENEALAGIERASEMEGGDVERL